MRWNKKNALNRVHGGIEAKDDFQVFHFGKVYQEADFY